MPVISCIRAMKTFNVEIIIAQQMHTNTHTYIRTTDIIRWKNNFHIHSLIHSHSHILSWKFSLFSSRENFLVCKIKFRKIALFFDNHTILRLHDTFAANFHWFSAMEHSKYDRTLKLTRARNFFHWFFTLTMRKLSSFPDSRRSETGKLMKIASI
jgi:hypothetical protein